MRILLVNDYHYDRGEIEEYYFKIAEVLEENGHKISFFSVNDDKNYVTDCTEIMVEQEKTIENDFKNKIKALEIIYSKKNKEKMLEAINLVKPNIIHIFGFEDRLSPSIIDIAKSKGIPVVYSSYNLKPFCPVDKMLYNNMICNECKYGSYIECTKRKCVENSEIKSAFYTLKGSTYRLKKVYDKMDHIIVTSEFMKDMFYKSGINNKVDVIPDFIEVDNKNVESKIGEFALYIGDLVEEKGIMELVKAFSGIENQKLYIAGEGPLKEEIKKYILKKGLKDSIKIVANLNDKIIEKLIKECRFLVYPSLKIESSPNIIIKTLANGKPVILPEMGGLPEIVRDGKNGLVYKYNDIIDLTDSMIRLFSDEDLVNVLGENAKEMAKESFSKKMFYKNLIGIYNLLEKKY